MRTTLTIGTASAEPGTRAFGKLLCEPLADGGETFVALTVVNGALDGPKLWIGSTIHGREIPGMEASRRVAREIVDPASLRGAIVCAMPLNPYGFRLRQHTVPQDGGNVNAKFPGDAEGTLSERLAHLIWTQGAARCDFVIDFHANEPGGIEFACATPCEDAETLCRTLAMAEAFGFPLVQIRRNEWAYDRSLIAWAQDAGKPAILAEPLCQGVLDARSIDAAVRGTCNVLKHLGMIDGPLERQTDIRVSGGHYRFADVRAAKSGLIEFLVEGGDQVTEGQLLGIVRNPWGDECVRVLCPTDACVRSVAPSAIVNAGQIVVTLLVPQLRQALWGL